MNLTQLGMIASITAAVGMAAYFAVLATLELGGTRDRVRDAVSDYGVGATRGRFSIAGAFSTLALVGLAVALAQTDRYTWTSPPVWVLGIAVLARLAVIALPTDLPGEPRTATGTAHLLAAIAQFAALFVVLDTWGGDIAKHTGLSWLQTATAILDKVALVGLVALCVCLVVPALKRWFGISERLFLFATGLWVLLAGLGIALAA